jgi:hypothetical protein
MRININIPHKELYVLDNWLVTITGHPSTISVKTMIYDNVSLQQVWYTDITSKVFHITHFFKDYSKTPKTHQSHLEIDDGILSETQIHWVQLRWA